MSASKLLFGLLLLGSTALTLSVSADGSGKFLAVEKLKTEQCGSSKAFAPLEFTLTDEPGTRYYGVSAVYHVWSVVLLSGETYTGVVTRYAHTRHTILPLYMDASAYALFTSMLADRLSELCETLVTPSDVSVTQATLTFNKRWTAAKVQIAATMTGGAGSGTYSLKAKGRWVRIPLPT
jgi:hypothetical protein